MNGITDQPPAFRDRALVDHLHRLGPGVLAEFLSETVDPVSLEIQLGRYARLNPSDPCGAGAAGYREPRPLAEVAAEVVINARLCRKARQLWNRPPRLLTEAVIALVKLNNNTEAAERILDNILRIPDEALDVLDCRDVPPAPIQVVSK